jgi:hypothetical protein
VFARCQVIAAAASIRAGFCGLESKLKHGAAAEFLVSPVLTSRGLGKIYHNGDYAAKFELSPGSQNTID